MKFHGIIEPYIESALNTIPPSPYPHIPTLYPLIHASLDTKGQSLSMGNQPNLHIFGLWEETGAPGGNPCRHKENVQTPHTDSDPSRESNPGPWSCEAAVLTTVLPCCSRPYAEVQTEMQMDYVKLWITHRVPCIILNPALEK